MSVIDYLRRQICFHFRKNLHKLSMNINSIQNKKIKINIFDKSYVYVTILVINRHDFREPLDYPLVS